MTDPKEFYKMLVADPETTEFMKTMHGKAESYGEDKDKYLNYLVGAIGSWYDSMEMMIANVETVKLLLLLNSIEQGMMLYHDMQRESDKSVATKPV